MPIEQEKIICSDCNMEVGTPFDNGDGKIRCAACAVDKYMRTARIPRAYLKENHLVNIKIKDNHHAFNKL